MKLPFEVDLKNKTVVITGGGGILCSGFGKILSQCGANICLLDINYEAAEKVAEEIRECGGKAIAIKTDVLDKECLESARKVVLNSFGKCDILINGAGGNNPRGSTTKEFFELEDLENSEIKSFFDLDVDGVSFVMNLNFFGTFITTQVFAKDMIGRENCCIINISSMNAFRPLTKIPAYSAAKSSVSNFTQWLAVHFASAGIRVNAIAPGFFVTKQNYDLLYNNDGTLTPRSQKILNHTPLGRFGTPEDLAGTLLWLVNKDASAFVTGTVIPVDGGFSAYSGV
jgi:NAD(P)-dependent dehydrogenase (short-subunit alcohol dehydrogenase family)